MKSEWSKKKNAAKIEQETAKKIAHDANNKISTFQEIKTKFPKVHEQLIVYHHSKHTKLTRELSSEKY